MPDISVKDQMRRLVDLQKIDGEIYQLKKELKEKPLVVEQFKEEFEKSKSHYNELDQKLKNFQLKRKELELDLKTKEDNILKVNGQLSAIKTNKEYTAKLNEIESIKADKSIIEEKILISYDEADVVTKELEKEKVNVASEEKRFLSQKQVVDSELKVIGDRIKVLEGQRNQFVPDIDRNLLTKYEKLLGHRDGLAIIPVLNNSCGGCYMNVNPQTINMIKMKAEVIQCEMCQRILYLEEDLT